ncbi:MAG: chondroitinase-B domain-containing protein [Calditrichia bacterium]
MQFLLKNLIYAFAIISFAFQFAAASTIVVNTVEQLEDAVAAAQPGDSIEVADGVYDTEGSITVYASGTEQEPIVIRAQNVGMAELTGESYFDFRQCAWIVLEGFLFTSTDQTVVKLQACNNVRITRNTFRLQETSSLKWVIIQGIWNDPNALSHHNRIDHNLFENKLETGNCITVDGTPDPTYISSQYDRIDRNHFRNVGPRATNEKEAIRVGWSELSMSSGYTVVEYNLFEDCDGDPEIVSVKTSDDTVRYNTFRRSQGTLSLRHGNRTTVDGNFFLGENKAGTGGIRVYGDDHVIINNYFEGLTGNTWDAPIALTNGDYDGGGSLSRHFRINRAIVAHNTLVDNLHHIEIGFTNNGNYSKPPRDVKVWNNLVVGQQNELVKLFTQPTNMAWLGNLMHADGNATPGISLSDSEIRYADPLLERINNMWKLSATSPAIDSAAVISYSLIDDIDGQLRGAAMDIGADEFSTERVLRQPLTAADVGPFANDLITGISPNGETSIVPTGVKLLQNYPNPFNPSTTLRFKIDRASFVVLQIFDVDGRRIKTLTRERYAAGEYRQTWNAANIPSGVYIVRLQTAFGERSQKILLLK